LEVAVEIVWLLTILFTFAVAIPFICGIRRFLVLVIRLQRIVLFAEALISYDFPCGRDLLELFNSFLSDFIWMVLMCQLVVGLLDTSGFCTLTNSKHTIKTIFWVVLQLLRRCREKLNLLHSKLFMCGWERTQSPATSLYLH
jgi:hypothetical protein